MLKKSSTTAVILFLCIAITACSSNKVITPVKIDRQKISIIGINKLQR